MTSRRGHGALLMPVLRSERGAVVPGLGLRLDAHLGQDAELLEKRGRVEVALYGADLPVPEFVDVTELEGHRAPGGGDLSARRPERSALFPPARELENDEVAVSDRSVDRHAPVGEAVCPHARELDRAVLSSEAGVGADEDDLTVVRHQLGQLVELAGIPVLVQLARDALV